MRIIGGKDYYDYALRFGRDPSLTLVRSNKEYVTNPFSMATQLDCHMHHVVPLDREIRQLRAYPKFTLEYAVVWFAGKTYSAVTYVQNGTLQAMWSESEFNDFVEANEIELIDGIGNNWFNPALLGKPHTGPDADRDAEIMEKNGWSIASTIDFYDGPTGIRNRTGNTYKGYVGDVSVNPYGLGKCGFNRVIPADIAMQELSMWVAGLNARRDQPVHIVDDKVKIVKAGFDVKSSFRHPVNAKHVRV